MQEPGVNQHPRCGRCGLRSWPRISMLLGVKMAAWEMGEQQLSDESTASGAKKIDGNTMAPMQRISVSKPGVHSFAISEDHRSGPSFMDPFGS